MTLRRHGVLFLIILLCIAAMPFAAHAAILKTVVPCDGVNCTVCDIATLAQNILSDAIFIAVFLSAILFAWAGFRLLTSAGSESQRADAKKIFWNVLVGILIILAAWLIVNTIMSVFLSGHASLPWNKLC